MDISNQLLTQLQVEALDNRSVKPSPNDPPWNSWIALLVWLTSVALVVIAPVILIGAYILPKQSGFADQQAMVEFIKSDPIAILLQVIAIIPAHILTLLMAWMVVTRFKTYSFRETLGWRSGGMRWWQYALILVGIFGLSAVALSVYPEADNDLLRMLRSSRAAVFAVAALATLTAPLVEEVIYRGILYSAFQRALGIAGSVAVVTILFAAVHFPQYWPSYSTLFLLTVLSLILTLVRVKTGNLLPCVILHTVFNGIQSVGLIAEPYLPRTEEKVVAIVTNMF